jgi:hypothetical protein
MNKPVSFELAKLLKEKGFDTIDCDGYYHICDGYTKGYAFCYSDVNSQEDDAILAPTIAEVCMWLYERHNIWVAVVKSFTKQDFWCAITTNDKTFSMNGSSFSNPTQAYEESIEYTLNNLI